MRIGVRYKDNPPLVVRFWTPPTDGTVWLDDIRLRPVQERVVEVPLTPPAGATGWGTVDWQLAPADARCEAEIIDPVDGHLLRSRLYSGDSLAPLDAVAGLRPVLLRLQVNPSAEEPVTLESVRVRFRK